jgi:hypothetical protein
MNAHEVAELVAMPEILCALGFQANECTRRCACILHGGSNRSAFSWTDAGLWKCHSCGAGGDRIALVRVIKNCGFREAVEFLAELAGVSYSPRRVARHEIERARRRRERAESAGWRVRDEVLRLRCYYRDGLHRAERLMACMGEEILRCHTEAEQDAALERMARLASPQTFFLAAYDFLCRASVPALVQFVLASSEHRRGLILGDNDGNT